MSYPFATSNIVVQAFGFMELSHPSSFADDTPQALDALTNYETALDFCLEWSDWSFVSRGAACCRAAVLPPEFVVDPDLQHTFALPSDCVKVHGARWRLDERLLRAYRIAPLPVCYTLRVTNEAALPASFRTSVSLQLAVLMAPRWLGVDSKRASLASSLETARLQVGRPDARTASPLSYQDDFADDWVAGALR